MAKNLRRTHASEGDDRGVYRSLNCLIRCLRIYGFPGEEKDYEKTKKNNHIFDSGMYAGFYAATVAILYSGGGCPAV